MEAPLPVAFALPTMAITISYRVIWRVESWGGIGAMKAEKDVYCILCSFVRVYLLLQLYTCQLLVIPHERGNLRRKEEIIHKEDLPESEYHVRVLPLVAR